MGMFTQIPLESFKEMQLNAGIILTSFDPQHPNIMCKGEGGCECGTEAKKGQIIAATKGGITINCTPTYSDLGSDVDNCPANLLELKHLDSWDCSIAFSSVTFQTPLAKLALGAADAKCCNESCTMSEDGTCSECSEENCKPCKGCEGCENCEDCPFDGMCLHTVTPRVDLKESDFREIWWVGDLMGGGFVAVKLSGALCTSGLSLKTTKNGKGETSLTMTGHVKAESQTAVPMEIYVCYKCKQASEAA